MVCPQCVGIEREFDRRTARADLRRYRRAGLNPTTRLLSRALIERGVDGATVLDIGGGVGALQHALLEAGAGQVWSVDASSAYLEAAREESDRRGWSERIESRHGDFVALAGSIEPADVVTLDRVICCYPDMGALVAESAARARRLYGVIYPRDAVWLRPGFWLLNLFLWLRRSSFRVFLHPRSEVEESIRRSGLEQVFHRHRGMWQVGVFARTGAS